MVSYEPFIPRVSLLRGLMMIRMVTNHFEVVDDPAIHTAQSSSPVFLLAADVAGFHPSHPKCVASPWREVKV